MPPKISVLMPVYKTPNDFLVEAIKSILNQTFKDFEFLILDDCPTDTREDIVKSFNDDRIKYFKNEKNLGISASRNKLINLASGEYLAVFDHDDISLPTRLEKEAKFLDENKSVGVVGCQMKFMYADYTTTHPLTNQLIKGTMLSNCCISHTASMIRKSVLIDNNIRYEANFSPCEDYMLWARLMDVTIFHNINEVLVLYRDSDQNTSHNSAAIMSDKTTAIREMLLQKHPFIKELSLGKYTYIKLLGIPFLKIKKTLTSKKYYLFGFIPFLNIKEEFRDPNPDGV